MTHEKIYNFNFENMPLYIKEKIDIKPGKRKGDIVEFNIDFEYELFDSLNYFLTWAKDEE